MHLKWRISHIRGYLELGMVEAAMLELQRVPPADASSQEVLLLRATILQEKACWDELHELAAQQLTLNANEPAWWILCAYAARRGQSLTAAEEILLRSETHHPDHPIIQFNLGCYACVRGDLSTARSRVQRAITLDPAMGKIAETDSDLNALRDSKGILRL